MRIDVSFTPQEVDETAMRDRTVVVIDVLRASSSIVTALANGAREVIPAATVEGAVKIGANLDGDIVLLAGERNAKIIPGFQLGNSPSEYTGDRVRGKVIVFSSTNGARALASARLARELAVCAFVNMTTVATFLADQPRDFAIVCSGTNGTFSLEDALCAGMLIDSVTKTVAGAADLSDGAFVARALYVTMGKDIGRVLRAGEHGRLLMNLGFAEDLDYCAGVDTVPVLPVLDGNVLRLRRDGEKKHLTGSPN
jgi:2-phosphosulfolactate phosphatase